MSAALLVFTAACIALSSGSPAAAEVPDDAEECGGYYEYRRWETKVEDNSFKTKYRERRVVLNPRGDDLSWFAVSADPINRIRDLKIEVFDSNGDKIYDRKLKDFARTCGYGASFSLYEDRCLYYIEVPGSAYPYAIEYEYERESKSLFFFRGVTIQERYPVERAEYRLRYPGDIPLHYRLIGLDTEPEITPHDDWTEYRFIFHDLEELDSPMRTPPDHRLRGQVEFSPHAFRFEGSEFSDWSWRGVGNWYRELAENRYLPLEDPGDSVTTTEPKAVLDEAYNRVVSENRYVAVSIGIGGWQPHSAAFTQEHGYGDCKDLATLLISYLRQRGIKAWPALVSTRGAGVIDPDFPSFAFNHVIAAAAIDRDTVWMDPTCEICLPGQLPYQDEDISVLLITDTGGVLVRTPRSDPDKNRTIRNTRITVLPDRNVSASSQWVVSGNDAISLYYSLTSGDQEDRKKTIEEYLQSTALDLAVDSLSFTHLDERDKPLELTMTLTGSRPLDAIGSTTYLCPQLFSRFELPPALTMLFRKVPFDLRWPHRTVDSVTIVFSGSARIDSVTVPNSDSVDIGSASCRMAATWFPDSVCVTYVQEYQNYEIPVDSFALFLKFMDRRDELMEAYVKLHGTL